MAKAKKASQKTSKNLCVSTSQKIIISVIVLAFIAVAAAAIIAFFCDNKFQAEAKVNELATSYYEDYFYPNVFSGNITLSEVLEQFKDSGLTPVTLRQMILSVPGLSDADADFLQKHCDEEATRVQYFPEPPYEKTSFRAEYTYSCNS